MTVPIYAHSLGGKIRYTISFYRDGKRRRRCFTELTRAKKEAKHVAEKIVRGMQAQNDLNPAERETFLAAQRILSEAGVPLTAAAEDYAICRKLLGDVPLRSAVEDFLHRTKGVKMGVTVPDLVEDLIAAKEQDGMSDHYMNQLRSVLGIFSRAFTGPIMDVKGEDIEAWLRSCLPAAEPTAAEKIAKVKVGATDAEIFQPEEMEKLLLASPRHSKQNWYAGP